MKKLLVILFAVALVFTFSAPAISADADDATLQSLSDRLEALECAVGCWSFYGSARVMTFWTDEDENAGDDEGLTHDLQGNSRLGAVVKKGDLGGAFEFAVSDSNVSTRLLYGTWNFGAGEILVGQSYTPCGDMFYSNQVFDTDTDLLCVGQAYNGRRPMLQLSIGGFKVALVKQHAQSLLGQAGDLDNDFPKIEAKYHFASDVFFADVFAGYQTYTIDTATTDYDIDSYVAGLGGGVNAGPVYVKATGYIGQNTGQYGLWQLGADDVVIAGGEIKDVETMGGVIVVGVKASDMLTFEAGLGYLSHDSDAAAATEDDETMAYYANCTVNIAKGFFIVPEVGVIDFMDDNTGADEGTLTYAGLKTQINF